MDINDKIENALKDINIVKIMNRASRRFKNQLDKDIIYSCHINALWKAFENYDETKGAKFTTYLYNGVFIECMKEIKFTKKSKLCGAKLHDNIKENKNHYLMIDIADELNENDKILFIDRLSNMTISEIGKKHGLNRETARRKVNKIMHNIGKKFA
jgi:DNA-directed RNA polymerase specialized sigma subunit